MFPALQELVDEPLEDGEGLSDAQYHAKSRKQSSIRLVIANCGYFTALAIVAPLVLYEHELQLKIEQLICPSTANATILNSNH